MSTVPTSPPVAGKARRRWLKTTAISLCIVFIAWLGLVDYIWRAMHRTPEEFGRVMMHLPWEVFLVVPFETMWTRARAGSVNIGDAAPDFTLTKLDKTGSIQLSALDHIQPVVMIFGSYT